MDKYFNVIFSDAMVKPQGLLRSMLGYVDDNAYLEQLAEVAADPNISIDSYGT